MKKPLLAKSKVNQLKRILLQRRVKILKIKEWIINKADEVRKNLKL